jgi:hypothetical protein
MQTRIWAGLFFLFASIAGKGQSISPSVINAGGATSHARSFSLEWSIGEIALVNTMQAPDERLMLTNGFLQPDKFDRLQPSQAFTKEEVTILPNPTRGQVAVWINTREQGFFTLSVHDAAGKELFRKKGGSFGSNVVERFDLTAHPAGSYFVVINLNRLWSFGTKQGTFRVVKL